MLKRGALGTKKLNFFLVVVKHLSRFFRIPVKLVDTVFNGNFPTLFWAARGEVALHSV